MKNKLSFACLLLSSSLLLSGCGSSSSDDSSPSLSGTAATGAAIAGGNIVASCHDGNTYTTVTDSSGRYTISGIPASAFGCALEVTKGAVVLHSYAEGNGTANITPLTDMTLALATEQDPGSWFLNFDSSTSVPDLATSKVALLDAFANKGFSIPSGDLFLTAFNANHTGWDALLDVFQQALDNASQSYATLLSGLQAGGAGHLDTSLPTPPHYSITGSISGATTGEKVTWELLVNGEAISNGDNLNGDVSYSASVIAGSSYEVKIKSAPTDQHCTVTNGSGSLLANVSNIAINCVDGTSPDPDPVTNNSSLTLTYKGTTYTFGEMDVVDEDTVYTAMGTSTSGLESGSLSFPADQSGNPPAVGTYDCKNNIQYIFTFTLNFGADNINTINPLATMDSCSFTVTKLQNNSDGFTIAGTFSISGNIVIGFNGTNFESRQGSATGSFNITYVSNQE